MLDINLIGMAGGASIERVMWNLTQDAPNFGAVSRPRASHAGAPNYFLKRVATKLSMHECSGSRYPVMYYVSMVRYIWVTTLISLGLLWLILSGTDPTVVNPIIILIVFVLVYIALVGIVTYILFLSVNLAAKLLAVFFDTANRRLSLGKAYIFSTVIALGPVILLAIRTVANIGFFDLTLVVLFELIAVFYIYRRI